MILNHCLTTKSRDTIETSKTFTLNQVLAVIFKVVELLKPLTEEWGSDPTLQYPQPHQGSEQGSGRQDNLSAAAKELQQAWGRSLHCQLQLQTRLEILLDWAVDVQQDGGTLGENSNRFEQSFFGEIITNSHFYLFLQLSLYMLILSSPPLVTINELLTLY